MYPKGWSGRCSVAPYPYGSSIVAVAGSFSPKCSVGYQGTIAWSPGYGWEGVCQLVPCPDGSSRPAGHTHTPACKCKSGYTVQAGYNVSSSGDMVWDDASSSWKGGCVGIPCPAHSSQKKDKKGLPVDCVCDAAYEQKLTFDQKENRWTGNCTVATSVLLAQAINTTTTTTTNTATTTATTPATTFQLVLSCCSAFLVVVYAILRYTDRLAGLIPKELREKEIELREKAISPVIVRTSKVSYTNSETDSAATKVSIPIVVPVSDVDAESVSVALSEVTEVTAAKKKPKLDALGAARFVASVHVVAGHLVNKTPSKGYDWPTSGWGFTWVPWFMMLSAFVLTFANVSKPDRQPDGLRVFMSKRLRGVYPLYLSGLLAAAAVDAYEHKRMLTFGTPLETVASFFLFQA
jgi:hypothetical protein